MAKEEFDEDFYMKTLRTADNCGISMLSKDTCARLCAIIYVFSCEEAITHSPKLRCDVTFIKEKYHIDGGEIPDKDFVELYQSYARPLEYAYDHNEEYPSWVNELIVKRYGFRI